MENNNQTQKIVVISSQEKSMLATVLLTIFFGPLGLFYATVSGGVIMLVITILVGVFTLGIGALFTFPICIIWGIVATNAYNNKIRSNS